LLKNYSFSQNKSKNRLLKSGRFFCGKDAEIDKLYVILNLFQDLKSEMLKRVQHDRKTLKRVQGDKIILFLEGEEMFVILNLFQNLVQKIF